MSANSRFAVAVHVLTIMALSEDAPVKSEHIADSVNTNPVVIRRIMCALARARLVVTQSGATGGSRLSRETSEITLLEVYRAVEGEHVIAFRCHKPNNRCDVGQQIPMVLQSILREIDEAVAGALGRITLDQIVQAITDGAHKHSSRGKSGYAPAPRRCGKLQAEKREI